MGERTFCDGCGFDTGVVRYPDGAREGMIRRLDVEFENRGVSGGAQLKMDLCGACYGRVLAFISALPDMQRRRANWWDAMKGGLPDGAAATPVQDPEPAELRTDGPFSDKLVACIADDYARWGHDVSAAEAVRAARVLAKELREWRRWSNGKAPLPSSGDGQPAPSPEPPADWTWDTRGQVNGSAAFLRLRGIIAGELRDNREDLVAGRMEMVAHALLSKLAHQYGLTPR